MAQSIEEFLIERATAGDTTILKSLRERLYEHYQRVGYSSAERDRIRTEFGDRALRSDLSDEMFDIIAEYDPFLKMVEIFEGWHQEKSGQRRIIVYKGTRDYLRSVEAPPREDSVDGVLDSDIASDGRYIKHQPYYQAP